MAYHEALGAIRELIDAAKTHAEEARLRDAYDSVCLAQEAR